MPYVCTRCCHVFVCFTGGPGLIQCQRQCLQPCQVPRTFRVDQSRSFPSKHRPYFQRLVKVMMLTKTFALWQWIYDGCVSHALIATFRRLAFRVLPGVLIIGSCPLTLLFHIGRRNSTQQGWMCTGHCLVLRQRRNPLSHFPS